MWIFSLNAQNIHWAKRAIGNQLDEGNGITIDNSGNTYITGQYESSTLNFGTVSITNNSTNNAADAFVAKFDVSGNCLWAKTIGGIGDENGTAIAVDGDGNIFVTGYYVSSSFTIETQTLTNHGDRDVFLIKFNNAGDLLWATSPGGTWDDEAYGVSCDGNGNAYITGLYWGNSMNFESSTITSNGDIDAFLAKYTSSGTLEWAKTIGGTGDERGNGIKTDAAGNIYLTGDYDSPSVNFGANTLSNSGTYDEYMFIANYTTSGTNVWAKSGYSNSASTSGSGVSLDQSGNCYVGGVFDGTTANFGTYTITNSNPGGSNAWIAKYSSAGAEQWVSNAVSGPEGNETYCITTDNTGNSYISGWFTSPTVSFGGIVLNSTAAGDNIFLVKYNSSGQVDNAYVFKGNAMSGGYGNAICSDNSGNAYLTGYFEGTSMVFGSTTLSNTGSWDLYWTKVSAGSNSLNEEALLNGIIIFPNPASDQISIEFALSENSQKTIDILDLSGRVLKTINSSLGQVDMDISDLCNGEYMIRASYENGLMLKKFVKN
jgi:hypothetical protein